MLLESPEIRVAETPDRIIMIVPGLSGTKARSVAQSAVREARRKMPKMSGASAARLQPLYGKGYFGIWWADSYVWFQDHGIQPFTMKSLAGKTIPMWVDDPTGQERAKNPKAKTRVTMSGKTQVLIFRRAANIGQRITKYKRDPKTGQRIIVSDKPASYPGAPGRIGVRETGSPFTRSGKVAGQIAKGNVGVRWRHPGIAPRLFLNNAVTLAAQWYGILPVRVYLADKSWRQRLRGLN
jgi:hypothetical protein